MSKYITTHWGTYKVLQDKENNILLDYWDQDSYPTKFGLSFVDTATDNLRIKQPYIRKGWLKNKGINNVSLFEVGPIYKDDNPEGQKTVATGLRTGNKKDKNWHSDELQFDFYDLKSDILECLKALSCPVSKLKILPEAPNYFHPGRSGILKLGNHVIACLGEINPTLLREMKTFIARGSSFSAKEGETDDLVMACVLVVRIAQQVAQYDENAYDELKDSFSDEEAVDPMPFVFLT